MLDCNVSCSAASISEREELGDLVMMEISVLLRFRFWGLVKVKEERS
jgi:hypothetical protein